MLEVFVLQAQLQVDALAEVDNPARWLGGCGGLLRLVALEGLVSAQNYVSLVPFLKKGRIKTNINDSNFTSLNVKLRFVSSHLYGAVQMHRE